MGMPIVSQVYVKKGSKREDYEDFVIVNEVDNGKVSFSNPFNDWFELSVESFNKKYVKGNRTDYDMFEEGQDIQLVEVNGKEYPVLSQGKDAYICLDDEGNKFKVDKNYLTEASSNAGDSYVSDLLKKDIGSLVVGDFENIPGDVGRGSLRKLADSLAKYMFAKFQGSKKGNYYGHGLAFAEVEYDSKNSINFQITCLIRASVLGEISFSTKIKGRNKEYKLSLSENTTMKYIRGFIEDVALKSYDKAVSND